MKASLLAHSAYAQGSAPIRTAQATEYDAFARITAALKSAAPGPDQVTAIHRNRELWTLLAGDVADGSNALPQALRAQIFYLAEFTSKHSSRCLAGAEDVAVLVDINTAVMRGLNAQKEVAG